MSFGGYDSFNDPYCYPGTVCLKNRLGITDPTQLEAFELEMSSLRAEEPLPGGRFGPAHYRRLHHHLFQDVYSWAGEYRTVRTSKSGNAFCYPEHIAAQMEQVLGRLSGPDFHVGAERKAFIAAAAQFLADLNAIHAFREGNGRTQLAFLHLVALRAGHRLNLERLEPEPFLAAMIASFHGKLDRLEAALEAL